MTTYLHIGLAFQDAPKVEELEPVFNKALDWLRYAPTCWVVRTSAAPRTWLLRLSYANRKRSDGRGRSWDRHRLLLL